MLWLWISFYQFLSQSGSERIAIAHVNAEPIINLLLLDFHLNDAFKKTLISLKRYKKLQTSTKTRSQFFFSRHWKRFGLYMRNKVVPNVHNLSWLFEWSKQIPAQPKHLEDSKYNCSITFFIIRTLGRWRYVVRFYEVACRWLENNSTTELLSKHK